MQHSDNTLSNVYMQFFLDTLLSKIKISGAEVTTSSLLELMLS